MSPASYRVAIAAALAIAGCTDEPTPSVVRKSAGAMAPDEIDRFRRAFEHAVARGYFDVFNDEHYDHHRNRNHGADVQATSPMTAKFMDQASGHRLLPWHRSFMLEGEAMLRAALRERNREQGRDPAEADLLFMPYWDAAHDRQLPAWVTEWQPIGGTAIVPPDLPPGHAGHGKEVGSRYDIVFGRWPAQNQAFDELPTHEHIHRILGQPDFVSFYEALDATPEIVFASYGAAQAGLAALDQMLPAEPAVDVLIAAFAQPGATDPEANLQTTNALFALAHHAAVEARKPAPDAALIDAVEDVYSLFVFPPHLRLHLWAGGLHPEDANVRGTVTYFNELCVDPVFWMIHTELDRIWYSWEKTHPGTPPLEGELAVFQPLTAEEGAWYGGGKEYHLEALVDHDRLPYEYALDFGH